MGEPRIIRDGADMVRQMRPERVPGLFVFRSVTDAEAEALIGTAQAMFREAEGVSVLVPASPGDDGAMAQITLQVYSALDGVGLTAAVSAALAEADIACNVIAAKHHDHIFVPEDDAGRAVAILQVLSDTARQEG